MKVLVVVVVTVTVVVDAVQGRRASTAGVDARLKQVPLPPVKTERIQREKVEEKDGNLQLWIRK